MEVPHEQAPEYISGMIEIMCKNLGSGLKDCSYVDDVICKMKI